MSSPLVFDVLIEAAISASRAIMAAREKITVEQKADSSPVTNADIAAQQVLEQHLGALPYPLISEESITPSTKMPTSGEWLLADPLDGTKGFLRGSDNFTLNLSLIKQNETKIALIAAPAFECLWICDQQSMQKLDFNRRPQQAAPHPAGIRLLLSRSEPAELKNALMKVKGIDIEHQESALKFSQIAEGSADFYLRTVPCMLWDSNAGFHLIKTSGGMVKTLHEKKVPQTNWHTPPFLASSKRAENSLAQKIMEIAKEFTG